MAVLATALRYAETLRHLRAVQVIDRVRRKAFPARPDLAPPPPLRTRRGRWTAPVDRDVILAGTSLTLLNQPGDFAGPAAWNDPARDKLWLYNLHYFDWLGAPDGDDAANRASIARWIAENPPAAGNGWEPYPLALRIVAWAKWLLAGNAPVEGMVASLAVQVRFMAASLEWHLLGNHLLADAKALWFAGGLFGGAEGDNWRQQGALLLRAQWADQLLLDGGHDERSPMYQAILLEDALDGLNLARALGDEAFARHAGEVARPMLAWLEAMTHPDGDIALFNDAAFGIAPRAAELRDYAVRLGLDPAPPAFGPLTLLADSGYARAQRGPAVLFADLAPVGPPHQPGHAHADTLGFELGLGGARVLVNCGVSTYVLGDRRAWERSTAAHNCVEVAGRDSSDVWAGFRTGRRARVSAIEARAEGEATVLAGSHDGYRFLPGKPLHRREWRLTSNGLAIEDRLDPSSQPAEAWFHLAPGLTLQPDGAIIGAPLPLRLTTSSPPRIVETERALGFNRRVPATSFVVPLVDGRATIAFAW